MNKEELVELREFVKKWMSSQEPDTFIKNSKGEYWYVSECGTTGIDLAHYFQELLEDYLENKKQQAKEQAIAFAEWVAKRGYYVKPMSGWKWIQMLVHNPKELTSEQLFELFLQGDKA